MAMSLDLFSIALKHLGPRPVYPPVGQEFELIARTDISSYDLVNDYGEAPNYLWRYPERKITTGIKKKFKLIQFKPQRGYRTIVTSCEKVGRIPEGVWIQFVFETFSHDGHGPIGIAETGWKDYGGLQVLPGINSWGSPDFYCPSMHSGYFGKSWRWLIEVE